MKLNKFRANNRGNFLSPNNGRNWHFSNRKSCVAFYGRMICEMNRKECVSKRLSLIWRYYPGICIWDLRKTTTNLSQDSRSQDRGSGPGPPESEAEVLYQKLDCAYTHPERKTVKCSSWKYGSRNTCGSVTQFMSLWEDRQMGVYDTEPLLTH